MHEVCCFWEVKAAWMRERETKGKEKIQEKAAEVRYEHEKSKAGDSSRPAGERIGAGLQAGVEKIKEGAHATAAEYEKQRATH